MAAIATVAILGQVPGVGHRDSIRRLRKATRTLARVAGLACVACLALAGTPAALTAREPTVLSKPPQNPDPAARYLFYLHGRILEGSSGRRPKHPQFGFYEYDALLAALGRAGQVVISEVRPAGARVGAHAERIIKQIEDLRAAGVPDDHIAVVGFSKGGWIAQRISAQLTAPIRYVLLAACPAPGDLPSKHATLHGQVLSVRERSDNVRSCKPLFARAPGTTRTAETVVAVGGGHGAFYRPNPLWLQPVLKFVTAGRAIGP